MPLLMDRAYEGDEMRKLSRELNYEPIVPSKSNRKPLGIMIDNYTKRGTR
jgi:hypothetical protein